MRIIAALHVDASLLKSSGTASNEVHLLYMEGKLHIDCNLRVFASVCLLASVCVFVCFLCRSMLPVLMMSQKES